jgi:hypothetical protein
MRIGLSDGEAGNLTGALISRNQRGRIGLYGADQQLASLGPLEKP